MKDALGLTLGALLDIPFDSRSPMQREAIAAAREALAQPEQEPVATTYKEVADAMNLLLNGDYKQVQMAQLMANAKLYTAPPKRPWVGLTDEQREACTQSPFTEDNYQDIEDKLKELNT